MKIIFFDGQCPMCHSWVRRIIKFDSKKKFRFAPLESEVAKSFLAELLPDYLKEETIIYFDNGQVYTHSDAVLRIMSDLSFPVNILKMGLLVPKALRDGIYNKVAANRYKFGKRFDSCPLPPVEWRDRFLI